jgi:cytoskeletal protein CcmA (bactofilin family)
MLSSFKGKSPDKHQDTPVNATDILTGTQRPVVEPAAAKVEPATKTDTDAQSCIGPGMSIVGKIECSGPAQIFGRIEGELQASDLLIGNGAQVEGTVIAQDLTIRGRVKGTIRAVRVRLQGGGAVEGDIFHRSLSIDEGSLFEGSSRRLENPTDLTATGDSTSQPKRTATALSPLASIGTDLPRH